MKADEIQQLLEKHGAKISTQSIRVWIPSVDRDKQEIPCAVIEMWMTRFVNLLSHLFGGTTAVGFRDSVLLDDLANVTGKEKENIFNAMATTVGGYIEQQDASLVRKLQETVLKAETFSDEDIRLMEVDAVIREPMMYLVSYFREEQTENVPLVIHLLKQMGRETNQVEVAMMLNGFFCLFRS